MKEISDELYKILDHYSFIGDDDDTEALDEILSLVKKLLFLKDGDDATTECISKLKDAWF